MHKIFLIYPPLSNEERYASEIGNAGGKMLPHGIYCLASFMRSKGYEVEAIDAEATNLSSSEITKIIEDFMPDFIGISSTTVAFHRAVEVASEIKKNSNIPIILGGSHVSSDHNHAMSFPVFDYAIFGEGEYSLYELCEILLHKEMPDNVAGLIFRDNNGVLVKNKARPYISNLDELPFSAYDLIPDITV